MKEKKQNLNDKKEIHIDYKNLIIKTISKSNDNEKLELIYRFSKRILD